MPETSDLGQAIALQTKATAYEGQPISRGIAFNMQNKLREKQAEAKRLADEEKRRAQIRDRVRLSVPKVHRFLGDKAQGRAMDAIYHMMDPNITQLDRSLEGVKAESDLKKMVSTSDFLNHTEAHVSNKNNLSFPPINQAFSSQTLDQYSSKLKGLGDAEKSLMAGIYDIDNTDPEMPMVNITTPLKRADVSKSIDSDLARRLNVSEYDLLNKNGNFRNTVQKLSDDDINNLAYSAVMNNPELTKTLVANNWQEAVDLYKKQPANLTEQEKLDNVDFALAQKAYKSRAYDKHGLRSESSLGYGGIIPLSQTGNESEITIMHPNVAGKEREYAATSAYNAQVELTNGAFPTSMVRDAKSGIPVKSKEPITVLKSGNIEVYPVYKKGTKGKDGKTDLSGRIVPNEVLNETSSDHYDYKTVLLGKTEDDDQVMVPFDASNDVMNTVMKGSRERRAQTKYDIDQANRIAAEKNRQKQSSKHDSEKIKVKNSKGQVGYIPKSQLNAALSQGYKQIQ